MTFSMSGYVRYKTPSIATISRHCLATVITYNNKKKSCAKSTLWLYTITGYSCQSNWDSSIGFSRKLFTLHYLHLNNNANDDDDNDNNEDHDNNSFGVWMPPRQNHFLHVYMSIQWKDKVDETAFVFEKSPPTSLLYDHSHILDSECLTYHCSLCQSNNNSYKYGRGHLPNST